MNWIDNGRWMCILRESSRTGCSAFVIYYIDFTNVFYFCNFHIIRIVRHTIASHMSWCCHSENPLCNLTHLRSTQGNATGPHLYNSYIIYYAIYRNAFVMRSESFAVHLIGCVHWDVLLKLVIRICRRIDQQPTEQMANDAVVMCFWINFHHLF